jgi:hypothetical protein
MAVPKRSRGLPALGLTGRAVLVGGLVLVSCAERPPGTAASGGDDEPTVYEADAFVLDDPGREPVLCLGGVAESLPPQCDGIPIVGWDWDAVEGEGSASDTRWGSFHVVGTYDGATFTVLEAGAPRPPEPSDGDPVDTPCPEPAGGWTSPDVARATEADLLEVMHAAEQEPDFAGFWIDHVEDPVGEEPVEPGGIIANVAFTGELERHEAEIRDLWGGPLCLVQHERTYDQLRGIQRDFGEGAPAELDLQTTWSSVDVQTNVVEVGVIVADDAARAAVEERYGEGAVLLVPALVPVSG